MILFVSGRCDIPAYYSEWLFHRFQAGFVDVRNPYDPHQISRIPLTSDHIDALLFCTKNPHPLYQRLDEIPFPFLIHVTLTPYHRDIEPNVPDKEKIIALIQALADKIGKQRIVVRYDPILLNDRYDIAYHALAFERMASLLHNAVNTFIISFVDLYKNTRSHQADMGLRPIQTHDMYKIGEIIAKIAQRYGIHVQTCGESIDLSHYGISKGACINKEILRDCLGIPYTQVSGKAVRECGCLPTVDIGDYNACAHLCRYCYANYDERAIKARMKRHDPHSSVLLGQIEAMDKITVREEKPYRQSALF